MGRASRQGWGEADIQRRSGEITEKDTRQHRPTTHTNLGAALSGTREIPQYVQSAKDELDALFAEQEMLAPAWIDNQDIEAGTRLRVISTRRQELLRILDTWVWSQS